MDISTLHPDFKVVIDSLGFVAKKVCDILGLKNRATSLALLDTDEKSYIHRMELGLNPGKDMVIINESGLYALIMRSRRPEAQAFRKWVTGEEGNLVAGGTRLLLPIR